MINPTWAYPQVVSIQVGDFNGDGRADLFVTNQSTGQNALLIGDGGGNFSNLAIQNGGETLAPTSTSQWVPTVGYYGSDRNAGIFWQETDSFGNDLGHRQVWVGRGDGSFVVSANVADRDGVHFTSNGYSSAPQFGDSLGRGLTDIFWFPIITDKSGNYVPAIEVWLNNGDGTFTPKLNSFTQANGSGSPTLPAIGTYPQTSVADFNGDGRADILFTYGSQPPNLTTVLWSSSGAPANLLSSVTTGLGNTTNISYLPLTNSAVYTNNASVNYPSQNFISTSSVVSSLAMGDATGDGIQRPMTYTYAGGIVNLQGRGFQGFGTETLSDIQGNVTTNIFATDWPRTGLIAHSATVANGQTVSSTQNTYSVVPLTGSVSNGATDSSYNSVVLHTSVKNTRDLDGTAGASTTTTYSYDNYANPVSVTTTLTDPGGPLWNSAVTTNTTTNIYTDDPTRWIIGRQVCSQVTGSVTGGGIMTRTTLHAYDGNTGQLVGTVIEPWGSDATIVAGESFLDTATGGGNSANVTSTCKSTNANSGYLRLYTQYGPNQYGNIASITRNPSDTLPNGNADPARTTSFIYDANQRLPATVTNALGQQTTYTYDWRFGLPYIVTSQDDQRLSSTTLYDGFGRPTQVTASDGTYVTYTPSYPNCTTTSTVTCPANGAFQWTVRTYGTNNTEFAPWQQTTYDALGRVVAQDSPTFDGQAYTSNRNRVTTSYNSLFQVKSVTQPYFANSSPTASTSYTYDALNRPTSVNKPACSIPETYGYSSGGLYATKTNCDSEVTYAWSSGSGVKIQSQDALGNVTKMQPAPFGKTQSVTDPAGNTTIYTYDNVGNLTKLFDPDSDTWFSSFDSFGELSTKTHNAASSQETYYFYDQLGRLTKRRDVGSNAADVWVYGATNTAGTVCDSKLAGESTTGGYAATPSSMCRRHCLRPISTDQAALRKISSAAAGWRCMI